jgi:hypothetical protein
MVVSINIDETVLRPNVRPAKPKSKRGPITFIAEIDEPRGRSVTRNLTRGVNEIDDPYSPPITDIPITVNPLTLDLEAYKISIEAGGGGLLPLALTIITSEEGEAPKDTAAIGRFNLRASFALPENMVTTPDDPSPL